MLRLITPVFVGLLAVMPTAHADDAFARAYQQAAALAEQGRYEDAQVSLQAELDRASTPEQALAGWKLMADIYEKQDRPEQALEAYQRARAQQDMVVQRQKQAIEAASQAVEASKQQIAEMQAEQDALEQQLEDLGGEQ